MISRRSGFGKPAALAALAVMVLALAWAWPVFGEEKAVYLGSQACEECHPDEYKNFVTYSKKVKSYHNVELMKKGLTDEEYRTCLECHTTGYGRPGGFVSVQETPHLKEAGCEVCHGPGSIHAETGDPEDIKTDISASDCEVCHNPERVEAFNYKPLIFGGAH